MLSQQFINCRHFAKRLWSHCILKLADLIPFGAVKARATNDNCDQDKWIGKTHPAFSAAAMDMCLLSSRVGAASNCRGRSVVMNWESRVHEEIFSSLFLLLSSYGHLTHWTSHHHTVVITIERRKGRQITIHPPQAAPDLSHKSTRSRVAIKKIKIEKKWKKDKNLKNNCKVQIACFHSWSMHTLNTECPGSIPETLRERDRSRAWISFSRVAIN